MKAKLKNMVKRLSGRSGMLRFAGRFAPPGAAILMYHSVQDEPDRYAHTIGAGITHATPVFQRHMELVARRFSPVTVEEIRLFLIEGKPLPPRAVAVTFDDGYADNAEIVAPILNRFGIRGSFYLTVSLIGTRNPPWFCRLRHAFHATRKKEWLAPAHRQALALATDEDRNSALLAAFDFCAPLAGEALEQTVQTIERDLDIATLSGRSELMMDWNQARTLQRAGHIVGGHTLTHPNVAHLTPEIARQELLESKRKLEEELSAPVLHFSYPHAALNPHWTPATVAITREGGYRTAVTTDPGPVRAGQDPLTLTRIRTPRPEIDFVWNLERAFLRRKARAEAEKTGMGSPLTT